MWRQRVRRFLGVHSPEQAAKIKMYLAIAYGITGWNLAIYIFLKKFHKELPKDPTERAVALARLTQSEDIHIYRIGGKKDDSEENARIGMQFQKLVIE